MQKKLMNTTARGFTRFHVGLYRLTGGKVGGRFRRSPVLRLTTTGKRTGKSRTSPLLYVDDRDTKVVAASNGGLNAGVVPQPHDPPGGARPD